MDIGGFRHGVETIFGCDWEENSERFYLNNFPTVPFARTDVRLVNLALIDETRAKWDQGSLQPYELDFLIAGSPCVKLSACNTTDARDFAAENLLMVETLPMLVRELKPKIVWFENSDRLCSKKNKPLYMEYKAALRNLLPDYYYRIEVMNAIRYGGYQTRSRTMTVLVRKDVLAGRKVSFFPAKEKVDLSKQGAHVLLPHISEYWAGQFGENFKSTVGRIFCTLTASGGEKVKDWAGVIRDLQNDERMILSDMVGRDFSGISKTGQRTLLGNMVMPQLAEKMFGHFIREILQA